MVFTPQNSMTERWAEFLTTVTFDDMPLEVVRQTKMFILDNIGCALGGFALDWGKKVVAVGQDLGGKPEATVVGSGDKLHCANAAYVNAKLANILDMDEVLYGTRHIGGVPVFPALNGGERVKATGKDVILATALAYDFGARCGLCGSTFQLDPEKGVIISDYGTMAYNTFAAAVAAARIFKLDKEQTINAFGSAAHFAVGAIEGKFAFTPPSNINKYADMGWFCLSGIVAALCAKNGYIEDHSALDGPRGLTKLLGAPKFDVDTFVADLGERWYIMDAGIKPYPTCRWFHTGIKLLEDIIKEHDLKPEDIYEIVANGHPMFAMLPTYLAADKWAESTGKELWLSQFSFTYALACTVYGIIPGPEWAKDKTLTNPEIVEMSRKITHGVHPDAMRRTATWDGHPGRIFTQPPTSVEVKSKKGTFAAESCEFPGDSWNPKTKLDDKEIVAKFINNACDLLAETQINDIIKALDRLDEIKNITELTRLLIPK